MRPYCDYFVIRCPARSRSTLKTPCKPRMRPQQIISYGGGASQPGSGIRAEQPVGGAGALQTGLGPGKHTRPGLIPAPGKIALHTLYIGNAQTWPRRVRKARAGIDPIQTGHSRARRRQLRPRGRAGRDISSSRRDIRRGLGLKERPRLTNFRAHESAFGAIGARRRGCGEGGNRVRRLNRKGSQGACRSVQKGSSLTVANNSKKFRILVDSLEHPRLYTPQQRGRRAAGANEFALVLRNQESRESDTQPGPKRKCIRAHDIASAKSVL